MPVETRKDSITEYWPEFPIDHASSPALGAWVVNGLAKYGNRLRHAVAGKYVDASLFWAKRGYSPMTPPIIPISGERVVRCSKVRERDLKKRDESTASLG